ncbi:sensor histidine kinase [Mucilaginibacter paludis]|uniref:Signal transduction histidine kinase n=1 Tax=Mucilaginibacter paludis DSM 18603 TaxID=714943 RepID=H1YHH0_9SPHI|nr:histidine kinase [Mucilaginibacter paludis]EHQ25504.1 putative signal transduction histidine kinase [Mucilaginibacter paludis DSM 18603]
MKATHFKIDRKYFWVELSFLLFLSFGVSLISDLEYSTYEQHDITRFAEDIGYRLITGSFSLLTYAIYYLAFLKRYVFGRKVVGIILCSVGFVIIDQLIYKFPTNWVIIHTDLVSNSLKKRAVVDLLRPHIIFMFNYRVIRSIIPLIGLAFLIRSLTQEREMKELKEQQLVSELNYLKAQLHPHFFFNTINNIYALALKQSVQTAPMIARLGEMMRYILYEADQPTVPLSRELTFLSDYIAVEKIRHQAHIDIQFDVQGIRSDYRMEPLLLLPFIENAFKHGLEEETKNGFVHIVICQTDQDLTLQVSNSVPQPVKKTGVSGIGIQNVRKRLDILYPDKYQLDINETPKLYEVNLILTNP